MTSVSNAFKKGFPLQELNASQQTDMRCGNDFPSCQPFHLGVFGPDLKNVQPRSPDAFHGHTTLAIGKVAE